MRGKKSELGREKRGVIRGGRVGKAMDGGIEEREREMKQEKKKGVEKRKREGENFQHD